MNLQNKFLVVKLMDQKYCCNSDKNYQVVLYKALSISITTHTIWERLCLLPFTESSLWSFPVWCMRKFPWWAFYSEITFSHAQRTSLRINLKRNEVTWPSRLKHFSLSCYLVIMFIYSNYSASLSLGLVILRENDNDWSQLTF